MRSLGIDYGEKRIGLALSDPRGRLALPHATVQRFGEVVGVARREQVRRIVVGLPVSLDGREGGQSKAVRAFAARLRRALQLPVAFENEMFTTKIAERHTSREKADASAAALILQSYLDRHNGDSKKQNAKIWKPPQAAT